MNLIRNLSPQNRASAGPPQKMSKFRYFLAQVCVDSVRNHYCLKNQSHNMILKASINKHCHDVIQMQNGQYCKFER